MPSENSNFKPLCPFCREPWSDENVRIEDLDASAGCETCGYGEEISGRVVIKCHKCNKIMYVKEFSKTY
jgi:hypothetical protein